MKAIGFFLAKFIRNVAAEYFQQTRKTLGNSLDKPDQGRCRAKRSGQIERMMG
jgi:hypothetical protein